MTLEPKKQYGVDIVNTLCTSQIPRKKQINHTSDVIMIQKQRSPHFKYDMYTYIYLYISYIYDHDSEIYSHRADNHSIHFDRHLNAADM